MAQEITGNRLLVVFREVGKGPYPSSNECLAAARELQNITKISSHDVHQAYSNTRFSPGGDDCEAVAIALSEPVPENV